MLFFFSALISLSVDVPIMTCCRCLLRFHPKITSSKHCFPISPSSWLVGCSSTRVSVCCSVPSSSSLWPVCAFDSPVLLCHHLFLFACVASAWLRLGVVFFFGCISLFFNDCSSCFVSLNFLFDHRLVRYKCPCLVFDF